MKTEAGLAVSYLRRTGREDVYVGVPAGAASRAHLPDDAAKGRFVTAVLKAKCQPGEELELFGESVTGLDAQRRARLRRRVGAIAPIVGLVGNLNVWENVSLPAAYHGAPSLERVAALAEEVATLFGLPAPLFLARLPDELSALERKIAAFIRLLTAAPELVVVDGLQNGVSRGERDRLPLFENELRRRLPAATLLYVDSREED